MVYCRLKMGKVTKKYCHGCTVEGSPDNCGYSDETGKQSSLNGFNRE